MKQFRRWLLVVAMILGIVASAGAKKVHTLGDSTMAPYDPEATNTRGWGMYFGNFLTNGWTSVNYAKGGRDSRGGYEELWQNAKDNVEAGDYVLIQFAHNDEKYNGIDNEELQNYYITIGDATNAASVKNDGRGTTPSTTYKAWLKKIIDEVKAKGATPILVSAVCRCYFTNGVAPITKAGQHNLADRYDAIVNGEYKTGLKLSTDDHSMDYTYQMKQLASEENVDFIDMTAATKALYEGYETYDACYAELFEKGAEKDNTHYNTTGALTAARMCAQLMKEKGILSDDIVIPTDLSVNPAAADMGEVYVGQSATTELTMSGLGLDPATGEVEISATDGILLSLDKQSWQNTLTVDYENGTLVKNFYAKTNVTSAGVNSGTITVSNGTKSVEVPVTVTGIELGGGDAFTATWGLTSSDAAAIDGGEATATDAKVEGMVKYANNSEQGLMVSTSANGAWVKAEDDSPNQYVQFTVTAPDGKKLDINQIAMKVCGRGGDGMRCHIYYSTDGFTNRTTIWDSGAMTSGVFNEVSAAPVIKLEEGESLQVRIYPWYTGDATGNWLCVKDVVIGGQSKDAAGVNIEGSITYALDKGGLNQGDDAVFSPETLTAGFAGKTWTYDGSNEKVVIEGTTFVGASGNIPMMQLKYTGASTETLSTVANDDCTVTLTLTPEDGFSFVPSKVSFLAGKFNSGNPHLTFAVEAGDKSEILLDNVEINRSKTNPLVDPSSFSNELNGYTAAADNPLKLHFSFLNVQGTRSAGISNLVIEGTLVGAAAQTTKYVLTTAVTPEGAGTITLDPEMATYKEGKEVTLTAKKNFGYKFKEWQDASGTVVSTDAETTITMDADKTMTAVFEEIPVYTVTTKVANDAERELGSVTLSPNDHNGKYEAGTVITATANETKILKFTNWEDNTTLATREITVNDNMTITANYEVQDFIAVFDASKSSGYASQGGYPFAADETWDANRNAKVSVVKQSDGTLVTGTNATPVVRNRANSGVLTSLSGVFQNGYNTAEIAWQYQFSTMDFTSATFEADMAAKNAATKNWKAQISTDGTTFEALGDAWEVTANTSKSLSFELPASAIGKETVYVRIMGTGTELLSDKYEFNAGTSAEGLAYATNSEAQIGNVYVIGEAVVEADEDAPVITDIIPANGAENVSASGKITISFDERIESTNSNGAVTLGNMVLTPSWSSRSVSFDYSALDYNTAYTFSMPANYVQDKSGNKYAEAVTITFTTMNRPTVAKGEYDKVVSTTEELVAAINEANSRSDKNARYRIFVKKGTYTLPQSTTETFVAEDEAQTVFNSPITYITASNISFIGEDRDNTIITNTIDNSKTYVNDNKQTVSIFERIGKSDVLQIQSGVTDTYFQDITIKSGMDDARGRNIALHDRGNRTICKNVNLWAYQDTYVSYNENSKYYFEGGIVRGRTDYVCGKGDVYYNKVTFQQVKSGYLAVPSVPKQYGYIFQSCKIVGDESGVDGNYTLGRPWGKGTPIALFIDTEMEVKPSQIGWSEMSGGYPKRFAEYGSHTSTGTSVDISGRKTIFDAYDSYDKETGIYENRRNESNDPVLTAEEAAVPTLSAVMGQDDSWQPTLLTEQAPLVSDVTLDGSTLSWTGNDYAFCYAICKDGEVIDFTTETTYNLPSSAKALGGTTNTTETYSVRAANEMGGLGEAVEAASTATGIINVNANANGNVNVNEIEYYTLDGKRMAAPGRGITIVRMRMADGSVISKKIVK